MSHALLIEAINTLHDNHDIQDYIFRVYVSEYHDALLQHYISDYDSVDIDHIDDIIAITKYRPYGIVYYYIIVRYIDGYTHTIQLCDETTRFTIYEFDTYRYLRDKYIKN
jgi:hypothetical protein